MLRRTIGTVFLIVTLGLTNCQAVVGTLIGSGAGLATAPGLTQHG